MHPWPCKNFMMKHFFDNIYALFANVHLFGLLYNTTLLLLLEKFGNMTLYIFKCTKMLFWVKGPNHQTMYCVKSVSVWSYTGSYFPGFRLNTERYQLYLRIQSESRKIRSRITPNRDTFHLVIFKVVSKECCEKLFEKQTILIRETSPS